MLQGKLIPNLARMPIPDGPFFAFDIFRLNTLMRTSNTALTPEVKARCWIVIDIIYSNLLDKSSNGDRKRSLQDIFYITCTSRGPNAGMVDWNPTVEVIPEINFAEEVYRWCCRNHDESEKFLDRSVGNLDQTFRYKGG